MQLYDRVSTYVYHFHSSIYMAIARFIYRIHQWVLYKYHFQTRESVHVKTFVTSNLTTHLHAIVGSIMIALVGIKYIRNVADLTLGARVVLS